MRPYIMFQQRAALFAHKQVAKDVNDSRPFKPRAKFNKGSREVQDLQLRPMTLHPVLDKIFEYGDDGIE